MKRILCIVLLWLGACAAGPDAPALEALVTLEPARETDAVASTGDAADDPAIWVHPTSPEQSLVLGTDKRAGLYVYDMQGKTQQVLPAGRLNNVDIRQDVALVGWSGDLAAASNRTDDTVTLFSVNENGAAEIGRFASLRAEPYGFCLGRIDNKVYGFIAHKTGDLDMYRIDAADRGARVATVKLKTQLEGCVHDDETGVLYLGEETRGVWRLETAADSISAPVLIDEIAGASGLVADVEGLTLYNPEDGAGYLIASSQGDNSYAVYERQAPHRFLGRFRIADGLNGDATEETDGIDASSAPLGPDFPKGVLVVQDGMNAPAGQGQNFKYVDWRAVEEALGL
ncbi:MAG: phytase [Pseudomonadota bacterium]